MILPICHFCPNLVTSEDMPALNYQAAKNMRTFVTIMALAAIVLVASALTSHQGTQAHPSTAAGVRSPVVVELFTSEGCSSCPPADAFLATLSERQPVANAEVIALEEHVDYWNDLGWMDPFSSREWTARQYVYSGPLGNGNPYTPQMVIDGKAELVGSNAGKARQLIQQAAGEEKAQVSLTQSSPTKTGAADFSVKIGPLTRVTKGDTAEVWLAVTETALHSAVSRGENAGEDLHHAAVVRTMQRIGEARNAGESSYGGDVSVLLKPEWKRENLKAVVLVQEKKSRRILGAAEIGVAQ